jgi:shikimate kinase
MPDELDNPCFPEKDASLQRQGDIYRVVLTGFMGAGKSTVGQVLARKMDWEFVDVDLQIQHSAGSSAQELFAAIGEGAFREFEADVLASCLVRKFAVIATGGAAIDLSRNRQTLADNAQSLVVFLDAPFDTLIERCLLEERREGSTYRPLLHKRDVAMERFTVRRSLYSVHAHLTVDVAHRSPGEVALLIMEAMGALNEGM